MEKTKDVVIDFTKKLELSLAGSGRYRVKIFEEKGEEPVVIFLALARDYLADNDLLAKGSWVVSREIELRLFDGRQAIFIEEQLDANRQKQFFLVPLGRNERRRHLLPNWSSLGGSEEKALEKIIRARIRNQISI